MRKWDFKPKKNITASCMLSVMNDTKRRRDNYVNRLCEVQNTIFPLA